MTDAIDLHAAQMHHSPAIADWPATVGLNYVHCSAAGGFELATDRLIPATWKWPSAPPPSTDNFEYTVWMFVLIGGVWHGAGFVQMWEGRAMGTRALPPIFADVDGVPGYRNWWGDPRRLWDALSDYVPQPGDHIGLCVSAGNGRLTDGVTSVAERSNVVLFTLQADDGGTVSLSAPPPIAPPLVTPPIGPAGDPPTGPPAPYLLQRFDELDAAIAEVKGLVLAHALRLAPEYEGTAKLPYLGSAAITLRPKI